MSIVNQTEEEIKVLNSEINKLKSEEQKGVTDIICNIFGQIGKELERRDNKGDE